MIARSLAVLLFLAVTKIQGDESSCNFPPSVWCSSREIAERCQVTEQCLDFLDEDTKAAPKVGLGLYMEFFCPFCQQFVKNHLAPAYKKIGHIMDVELVAYGNTQEHKKGDKWVFTCQHGARECLGDIIETCATHLYNKSVSVPFILCLESGEGSVQQRFSKCAPSYNIDRARIFSCVNSPQGNQWEHEAGVKTQNLRPPCLGVPWITLNGVHTDKIETEARTNLVKLICDTYTGVKPAACHTEDELERCYKEEKSFSVV